MPPSKILVTFLICYQLNLINTEETEINLIKKPSNRVIVSERENFVQLISEQIIRRQNALKEIFLRVPELRIALPRFRSMATNHRDHTNDLYSLAGPTNNASRCSTDLRNLGSSLMEKWTLPLIDSYGKPPSGILRGNLLWPGNYDQCRKFEAPITDLFPSGFQGRYCLLKININISLSALTTGICVPNTCNSQDLMKEYPNVVQYLRKLPIIGDLVKYYPDISVDCLPESDALNASSIVFVVFICLIFAIVASGTGYDIYERYYAVPKPGTYLRENSREDSTNGSNGETSFVNNSQSINDVERNPPVLETVFSVRAKCVGKFLLCFSALKNGESILDTSVKPGQMNCLHGMRFISMSWVILGHVYANGIPLIANPVDVVDQFSNLTFLGIGSATFSVDTFFLLSGFLLTYLFLKDKRPFTLKKLGVFYTHRYIRLTPLFMMVVFAMATYYNFMGNGPYWPYQDRDSNICTKYFWRNFLYLNNFIDSQSCVGWAWYLANDMQFFIISPIFLVFLKSSTKKWRNVGLAIVVGMMVICWAITIFIVWNNKYVLPIYLRGKVNIWEEDPQTIFGDNQMEQVYEKPWCRIGPYLIGCLLGYVIVELKGERQFLSPTWNAFFWGCATTLALIDVYGVHNAKLDLVTGSFFYGLSRSAWAIAVAWVIFACLTGHGGLVDKLLSWNLWFPLSRLTYCAYLTHPMIMDYYYKNLRSPVMFSNTFVAIHYLGFLVLTYGVAFVTSIAFESPIIRLEKLFREGVSRGVEK